MYIIKLDCVHVFVPVCVCVCLSGVCANACVCLCVCVRVSCLCQEDTWENKASCISCVWLGRLKATTIITLFSVANNDLPLSCMPKPLQFRKKYYICVCANLRVCVLVRYKDSNISVSLLICVCGGEREREREREIERNSLTKQRPKTVVRRRVRPTRLSSTENRVSSWKNSSRDVPLLFQSYCSYWHSIFKTDRTVIHIFIRFYQHFLSSISFTIHLEFNPTEWIMINYWKVWCLRFLYEVHFIGQGCVSMEIHKG